MPEFNNDRLADLRNSFDQKGGSVLGFLGAVIDTMQNWNDSLQAQVPGFRDRIVHVFLSAEEGGLNLDMPQDMLKKLAGRGACAGQALIKRFTAPSPVHPPQTTNWDNHRWIRLRTTDAMLQQFLADFAKVYSAVPSSWENSYDALVSRQPGDAPYGYPLTPGQRTFAVQQMQEIVKLGAAWGAAAPNDFESGSPRPSPELQVRPRI
jgi:hypothetical protein